MTDERPTPETDELSQSIITHNNTYACYEQMKMHARCLERERDEARELIDDIWITATSDHRFIMPPSKKQIPQHIEGIIKAYDKAHDDWTPEEIKTLMRERDEAKKEIKNIKKLLLDPNAVHINMLHGQIAKLDWEKLEHIHGNHPAREQLSAERALADRLGNALEKIPWTFAGREEQASEEWNALAVWKEARND